VTASVRPSPNHEVPGHPPLIRIDKNAVRIRCIRDGELQPPGRPHQIAEDRMPW